MQFPFYKQIGSNDCGPTCLFMVARYFGKKCSITKIKGYCQLNEYGVSLYDIKKAAEKIGFKAIGVSISYDILTYQKPLPCIIPWNKKHFVIVYEIKKDIVYIANPASGLIEVDRETFLSFWTNSTNSKLKNGIALLLLN